MNWTLLAADMTTTQLLPYIGIGALVLVGLIFIAVFAPLFNLWIQALSARAGVGIIDLIGMRLRKVPPHVIVLSRIQAVRAGLDISTGDLENHLLAGGRPMNVVRALIAANRANIDLTWKTATAIDLAGRDILDAVQTSVNPKVIDCPNPSSGKATIDAVAKDGIQVKAKARVTVRTNIARLVGGAKLQADQAEADKRRFQAEAEKRRALAIAQVQEFKAEIQKNQALVVLAESEVPKAMAEAFRKGNMGIMDYYRLRNIQSDTAMRSSIAGENQPPKQG